MFVGAAHRQQAEERDDACEGEVDSHSSTRGGPGSFVLQPLSGAENPQLTARGRSFRHPHASWSGFTHDVCAVVVLPF
jgi:hypothetical protein